ncbi:hypothetical protein E2562_030453 [Oryza meyeriana var. granulata]|uniref:O-methyltransferase domain-containing protein n=1 Tax=Oryza meyeriana var. granulata TaxID=110450 RepID=A0A6G1BPA0_9ORYZ|nr:hypothetical protein E2562_030453 [Oryza meyeriana var. granulata]
MVSPAARRDATNANDDDEKACMYAMELLSGPIVSMTLKAAIELGLIDELLATAGGHHAVTAEELAARLRLPAVAATAVDRMLRFLASYSVVRCTTEPGSDGNARRSYAAAPVCKWLAGHGDEGSVAPLGLLNLDKVFMECWYSMKDAISEGLTPFDKAYGMPIFEYLRTAPNEPSNTLFNQAMASHSVIVTKKLLEFFRGFDDGVEVLVDVGGGIGATLQMITARHARLRGVNFDLPHVIAQAPPVEGVEHVGGSMFDHIPTGNAILLKWVLHLWDDSDCAKILMNCYKALPANGKVIVVEYVLPGSPEPTPVSQAAFLLDVVMLNRLRGGKERTEREYAELAIKAGFSGECKATYIFTNVWALEFHKKV